MERPKLRKLDRTVLRRGDEVLVVLRDPLGISEPAAFAQEATQVLDMLDGQRTPAQLRQSLLLRGRMDLSLEDVLGLLTELGDAGFLDDDRFRGMWEATRREFMASAVRAPRFAGLLYPADPTALRAALRDALPDPAARLQPGSEVIGVLLPYQPIEGRVAALVNTTLQGLPPADALDLVVLLGTDHHPGRLPFAITDKAYDTPLGQVANARAVVDALDRRLPWIRREELRHRESTSLELAALLLRHVYGDACPPVLPVLCGQAALGTGEEETATDAFLATMEHVLEGRRVLWWISAELSHAGPAFGRPALAPEGVRALAERDLGCLDSLCAGRPEQLAARCLENDDQLGHPSGAAALSTLARLLPVGYRAELVEYLTARPPGPDEGWLGLVGMRFRGVAPVDDDE
ncbi:AmmeMemoRadiSam system protein B [Nannocystis sp.]|uniref:AmmeMemoRadiSam system protein B n=1 Tax=Nannocystis sp. TaxID=1962667 RepID=UPI002426BA22|nr:AmmeMemoRadiSam system protein B [Nannocystis sp.]MBK7823859.1 AmmeMemoRadiSam system protein B [Nannocystis sp.]MBK9754870.1 AmmeMemoRadiSam system protein B [Nannocystis sp.]